MASLAIVQADSQAAGWAGGQGRSEGRYIALQLAGCFSMAAVSSSPALNLPELNVLKLLLLKLSLLKKTIAKPKISHSSVF